MQFGIFSIGDLTTDPNSGKTPSEAERIRNLTEIAPVSYTHLTLPTNREV